MKKRRFIGQAIVEYALIGALVIAVILPSIKPAANNIGLGVKNSAPVECNTPVAIINPGAKSGTERTALGVTMAYNAGSYVDPNVNPGTPGVPLTVDPCAVANIPTMSNEQLAACWLAAGEIVDDTYGCELNKRSLHDPYVVNVNGSEYVFVQDKNKNGKINSVSHLLGYSDSKDDLFSEMKALDNNKDGVITTAELKNANVKLLKKVDGKLTTEEFSLDNIKEIDLKSFAKSADNDNGQGTVGTFNVVLADNSNAQGKETFDPLKILVNMLSAIKDVIFSWLN